MKLIKTALFLLLILTAFSCMNDTKKVDDLRLWYEQPADTWTEALPVGNGRLGAMVFGGVYNERIQVNEESLWAGERLDTNNPEALQALQKIRQFIFEEKIEQAYKLGNKSFLGIPPRVRSYQTLGDIFIKADSTSPFTEYKRELVLNTGLCNTSYAMNGVKYSREVFASAPDNVLIVRLSADTEQSINARICLLREKNAAIRVIDDNTLLLEGQIMDDTNPLQGEGGAHMKFAAKLLVANSGGKSHCGQRYPRYQKCGQRPFVFYSFNGLQPGQAEF